MLEGSLPAKALCVDLWRKQTKQSLLPVHDENETTNCAYNKYCMYQKWNPTWQANDGTLAVELTPSVSSIRSWVESRREGPAGIPGLGHSKKKAEEETSQALVSRVRGKRKVQSASASAHASWHRRVVYRVAVLLCPVHTADHRDCVLLHLEHHEYVPFYFPVSLKDIRPAIWRMFHFCQSICVSSQLPDGNDGKCMCAFVYCVCVYTLCDETIPVQLFVSPLSLFNQKPKFPSASIPAPLHHEQHQAHQV